jgi:hypothetical protein
MKSERGRVVAVLGAVVLAASALSGCEKHQSAASASAGASRGASDGKAAVNESATTVPAEVVRRPAECSAAKSAAECGDILKQEGKDPTAEMPPCKSGAAKCEVWERMWPQ